MHEQIQAIIETYYQFPTKGMTIEMLKAATTSFTYHELMHGYQDYKMSGDTSWHDMLAQSSFPKYMNLANSGDKAKQYLYDILYHTSNWEQNAYNSQSRAEYLEMKKKGKDDKLYMDDVHRRLQDELNYLENDDRNHATDIIKNELGGKTIGQLRNRLHYAYEKYRNKLSQWDCHDMLNHSHFKIY